MEILGVLIIFLTVAVTGFFNTSLLDPLVKKIKQAPASTPVPSIISSITPSPIPDRQYAATAIPVPTDDQKPWGVAEKIRDHTYTIKIENEEKMSTPNELLKALNDYRIKNGSQPLRWEEKICSFAQERAEYQAENGLDAHQGFNDYLENQDGFQKLGFAWLGENASQGYIMSGQHLIEFIFASDEEHDQNQLQSRWDRTCIAIVDSTVEIIFATSPI